MVEQKKRIFGACSRPVGESLSVYLAKFLGFARLGPGTDAPDVPRTHRGAYGSRYRLDWITATYVIAFESIIVNMGDPSDDAKESGSRGLLTTLRKPPMRLEGVSVAIVLGGRESRLHGEGRQLVGIPTQNNRMLTGMKFP